MRRPVLAFFLVALAGTGPGLFAQAPPRDLPPRLPDGRSRELAISKEDHEKTLADVAEIRKLAAELEEELQKQTAHVTSLESLRKAERIEDLAQKLQKRMKRIP